ncbi:MAG: NAD-dependent epimerase/dehydratase family protein [Acidiferrobacteraceae bacterium]
MRVAVTGSASRLAQVVIPRLLAHPGVTHVIGIDLRPGTLRHDRFESHVMDIRSGETRGVLSGVDAVVHLAFVVMRSLLGRQRRDRELMRSLNVDGSQSVFSGAAAAGAHCLIHCSSASVYGWGERNERLDEHAPFRSLPGFFYAEDKIRVERLLDAFEPEHPGMRIVRLRPHAILGPHAQPILKQLATSRIYPLLPRPHPLIQCVHEEDVADALLHALFEPTATGAFNLATDDAESLRSVTRSRGFAIGVPLPALHALASLSWWFGQDSTDPAWVAGLRHSLVLDTTRARDILRWTPRYRSMNACIASMKREAPANA